MNALVWFDFWIKTPSFEKNTKVGCIFSMVFVSLLPNAEFGQNYHWKDAPHFKNLTNLFAFSFKIVISEWFWNKISKSQLRKGQIHLLEFFLIFKGSSDPSHFIFEINVRNSRIRHRTTFKLNDEFLKVNRRWYHSI